MTFFRPYRHPRQDILDPSEIQSHAYAVRAGAEVQGDVAAGVCDIAAVNDVVHAGLAYRDTDGSGNEGGDSDCG